MFDYKISIETFENMLKNRNTSYKLFLMKYLLDNISENKINFSFRELSCGLVSHAWEYYETNYERFTKNDRIYDLVQYILSQYPNITIYSSVKDVLEFLLESSDREINIRLKQLSACAPYRLLFPFVKEYNLSSLPWDKQNKKIEELSQQYEMFYEIHGKEIKINNKWLRFICCNRLLVCQRLNLILKSTYEKKQHNLC